MQGINYIEDDSTVLVLYGDTPLITKDTINELLNYHNEGKYACTVLTALLDDPTGYGRIVRDERGKILRIVEQKDTTMEERLIKEINSGIYCFSGKMLKYGLENINDANAQGELYLTDVIEILKNEGYNVGAHIIKDATEIHGINDKVQLSLSEKIMRKR